MAREFDPSPLIGLLFFLFLIVCLSIFSNTWLAIGISVAIAVIGSLATAMLVIWIDQKQRCMHGIRRGKSGGCTQCIAEERRRRKEWYAEVLEVPEEQHKRKIEEEASALRDSEVSALRKRWLSRSELYFEMNSQEFEDAVAELFRELGYEVTQTPYSNDRGKDAIACKDGKKYLIECKRYDATNTIGRRDLAILVAAMKEENAQGGIYVNTGRFANTTQEYAAQENIELFDRTTFPALVNRCYPIREDVTSAKVMCLECGVICALPVEDTPAHGTCANGHEVINSITTEIIRSMSSTSRLSSLKFCDRCGSRMRVIKGKYGKFWACTKYPDCKFTRRMRSGRTVR